MRKTTRRKWARDKLVAIHPEALAAAIHESEMPIGRIARLVGRGEKRQTLFAMTRGTTPKRCRASRRARLAAVLDVPEWYLGGEEALDLERNRPGVVAAKSPWDQFWKELFGTLGLFAVMMTAPRAFLALLRLDEAVRKALARDEARSAVNPAPANESRSASERYESLSSAAFLAFVPAFWRLLLLRDLNGETSSQAATPGAVWRAWVAAPRVSPEAENAARAYIHWLRWVLDPWLKGEALLSDDGVRDMLAPLTRRTEEEATPSSPIASGLPPRPFTADSRRSAEPDRTKP
jgi:hypothetical protein